MVCLVQRCKSSTLHAEPTAGDFVVIFVREAEEFGEQWYVIRETNGPAETWLSFQSIAWPVRVLRPAGVEV